MKIFVFLIASALFATSAFQTDRAVLSQDETVDLRIQSENMAFDLFWVHLFDYKLEGDNLYREARGDWGYLP